MRVITSNLAEIVEKMEKKAAEVGTIDVSAALVAGVNAAMGSMKNRVFNQSQDANGEALGKYGGKRSKVTERKHLIVPGDDKEAVKDKKKKRKNLKPSLNGEAYTEYEKERLGHGRQIEKKDLEMWGTLRRSIVVAAEEGNRVQCICNNEEELRILRGQERQIGRLRGGGEAAVIFSLSNEEREEMVSNIKEGIKQLYAGLFND